MSKKLFILILFLFIFSGIGLSQSSWPPPLILSANPIGSCANGILAVNTTASTFWGCAGNSWIQLSSGGGGGFQYWTQSSDGSITGLPKPSTDTSTLILTPSLSTGGSYNIFEVGPVGTVKQTNCANLYMAVQYNGNLCFSAPSLTLNAPSQTLPGYLQIYGGSTSTTGASIQFSDSASSYQNELYSDPTTPNTLSIESWNHTGAATASNRICTPGNALCGGAANTIINNPTSSQTITPANTTTEGLSIASNNGTTTDAFDINQNGWHSFSVNPYGEVIILHGPSVDSLNIDYSTTGGNLNFLGLPDKITFSHTANNDINGQVTISSSTTGSFTFPSAYSNKPVCIWSPTGSSYSGGIWWDNSTASTAVINVTTSGSYTFNYICMGYPN